MKKAVYQSREINGTLNTTSQTENPILGITLLLLLREKTLKLLAKTQQKIQTQHEQCNYM